MAKSPAKQLEAALKRTERELFDTLKKAVGQEAAEVRNDERRRVPVDTGELRAGIKTKRRGLSAEVGVFDPKLWWAIFIEFGRKSAPAQPFATPTAEVSRRRWPGRAADAVRKAAANAQR